MLYDWFPLVTKKVHPSCVYIVPQPRSYKLVCSTPAIPLIILMENYWILLVNLFLITTRVANSDSLTTIIILLKCHKIIPSATNKILTAGCYMVPKYNLKYPCLGGLTSLKYILYMTLDSWSLLGTLNNSNHAKEEAKEKFNMQKMITIFFKVHY